MTINIVQPVQLTPKADKVNKTNPYVNSGKAEAVRRLSEVKLPDKQPEWNFQIPVKPKDDKDAHLNEIYNNILQNYKATHKNYFREASKTMIRQKPSQV